jgi:hypothetical protein
MKGSLSTAELMSAVIKRDTGLRTARRVGHCFILVVPPAIAAVLCAAAMLVMRVLTLPQFYRGITGTLAS